MRIIFFFETKDSWPSADNWVVGIVRAAHSGSSSSRSFSGRVWENARVVNEKGRFEKKVTVTVLIEFFNKYYHIHRISTRMRNRCIKVCLRQLCYIGVLVACSRFFCLFFWTWPDRTAKPTDLPMLSTSVYVILAQSSWAAALADWYKWLRVLSSWDKVLSLILPPTIN